MNNMDNLQVAIIASFACVCIGYFLHRHFAKSTLVRIGSLEEKSNQLEKAIHLKERDFLEERNKADVQQSDKLKSERELAYREGREAGLAEKEKDCLLQLSQVRMEHQAALLSERDRVEVAHALKLRTETDAAFKEGRESGRADREKEHQLDLVNMKLEYSGSLTKEREAAANDAVRKVRAEFELQTKMFSVSIRPYVRVVENKGIIYDDFETESGYQYQLLVNGIPAFKPHIIVESNAKSRDFKEENLQMLLGEARKAAEVAVNLYMGGSGNYVKYAPDLIERLTKK